MIEMTSPQLSAAAAASGGRLPFPLADDETASSVSTVLPSDVSTDELEPLIAPLLAPRRVVYSVAVAPDGRNHIAAAVEASSGACVGVSSSNGTARLTAIDPHDLVKFLVDDVAGTGVFTTDPLFERSFTVPQDCFAADDPGETGELLRAAGVPDRQVDAWLCAGRPLRTGLLGAVATIGDRQHHVRTAVAWRTYAHGNLLLVEPAVRGRRARRFEVLALDRSRLTRAAIDLLAALNRQADAEYATLSETHH